MTKKSKEEKDLSTEGKIKEAAIKVFTQKGYAATRTRDIVEEAGINLALLNYYFRSKEKLFEIIMLEKVEQLFGIIAPIINDAETSLDYKIEMIASRYIDMLLENPDLPLFVLSEIRTNPEQFGNKINAGNLITKSVLIKQFNEVKPDINPLQFVLNLLGLCVFPFIAKPVFQTAEVVSDTIFKKMITERKALIPIWIKAMLKAT